MYDKDYLEYDSYGLRQVNCMRCNIAIKRRTPRPDRLPDGREVYVDALKTLSNFIQIPFTLTNNSRVNILLCKDCKAKYSDSVEEMQGMTRQIRRGRILEAKGMNRPEQEIDLIKERVKALKVKERYNF